MKFIILILSICFITVGLCDGAMRKVEIKIGQSVIVAEIAKSPSDQRRGLGYRDQLEANRGMLFVYNNPGVRSFWMKGMRFAIDIIWLRQGRIVLIEKNVQPSPIFKKNSHLKTYGSSVLADMVLEVSAGFSDKMKLSLGQHITINE
ncbi:MAG: DUF192 domain-containing protein [Deltaproteobacteria bacterium]|jgi:uncharacterized protein|nr:DUF192 domain-containing protein [Deltaproteobacteria bacterium]